MTQKFFGAAVTPLETDLDANFTDLYNLREFISTPGYTAATPKMTLDSSGNLLIGKTTQSVTAIGFQALSNGAFAGTYSASGSGGEVMILARGTNTGNIATFTYNGSIVGSVSTSGTAVSYNTSSDYRLKSNVQALTGSGAFIDALKPSTWTWRQDGTSGAGFIAHELQAVSPSSVHGTKDATEPIGDLTSTSEGESSVQQGVPRPDTLASGQTWSQTGVRPVYQTVEYGSSEVVAMLVAEVQSLRARLHALDGN